MHAELAAVREKAKRKGVDLLQANTLEFNGCAGWIAQGYYIPKETASLIVTGSLSKWLAGQGIKVYRKHERWCFDYGSFRTVLNDATDHLSALLAATNARLDELPDKEGA